MAIDEAFPTFFLRACDRNPLKKKRRKTLKTPTELLFVFETVDNLLWVIFEFFLFLVDLSTDEQEVKRPRLTDTLATSD